VLSKQAVNMTRLSPLIVLGLVGAAAATANPQTIDWEARQKQQHKDAECDNGCFFDFFTNKCNADNPACFCTLAEERQKYYCCVAEKCEPHVFFDSLDRHIAGCVAWDKPIETEIDTEATCGIKMPALSTSFSASITSAPSTSAPASSTTGPASSSAAPSTTGDEAPATSESSPPEGGATRATAAWSGVAVLLGLLMW
jgi:hypothetical protein